MSVSNWVGRAVRRAFPSRLLPMLLQRGEHLHARMDQLERHVESMREALGRIEARQLAQHCRFREAEFRVFSQWGEDGVLEYLIRNVELPALGFVELGVESYHEANTRFLLVHRNWPGVVVEADPQKAEQIRESRIRWRHDLGVVERFVTRENVAQILRDVGYGGEFGVLSVDLDGVDWWIWDAIEEARPGVIIVEYNWRFGPKEAVTVPYRADFLRQAAHPSLVYFGASLEAFCRLGRRKGYDFVGCESHGANAFFVRSDLPRTGLPTLTATEGFVEGRCLEAHDEAGQRSFVSRAEECATANGQPLIRIDSHGRPEA